MKPKVVHVDARPNMAMPLERAAIEQAGAILTCAGANTVDEIIAAAQDAHVLITDHARISRAIIEQLPLCLAIIRTGTGYDSIDVEAATEHGIIVINFPDYCTVEVANHALMFIMACAKRLIWFDQGMRYGHWPEKYDRDETLPPIGSIYGEQLGIVGLGRIGRALAVRAQALGMQVSAYDPYIKAEVFAEHRVRPAPLDEVLETSDYVSLHTPLTPETHHMIGTSQLRRMKRSAYLINTSRGKVVDQAALIHALQEGWIAGAGLDVFEDEPLPPNSPLLEMSNVILTPHVAGRSDVAFTKRLPQQVGEEAARVIRAQWPRTVANPGVKGRSRLEQWRQSSQSDYA